LKSRTQACANPHPGRHGSPPKRRQAEKTTVKQAQAEKSSSRVYAGEAGGSGRSPAGGENEE